MLRGHSADVNWASSGFVMGTARDKVRELHDAELAPWDKAEFKPGVVIEKFDDDFSGAKKAGLQEGDVLLLELRQRGVQQRRRAD